MSIMQDVMTDEELEALNEDSDFVYDKVMESLY